VDKKKIKQQGKGIHGHLPEGPQPDNAKLHHPDKGIAK
jgi:hypothetical protein